MPPTPQTMPRRSRATRCECRIATGIWLLRGPPRAAKRSRGAAGLGSRVGLSAWVNFASLREKPRILRWIARRDGEFEAGGETRLARLRILRMRKNVGFGPAGQIELGARRKEGEALRRERRAAFAGEHRVESRLELVQIEHVRRGIGELRLGELFRSPVRRLLLLGNLDTQKLAHEILEAVAIRIGARKLGGDLGAINGLRRRAEGRLEHGEVETREMEDLQHLRVSKQPLQIGRALLPLTDLHEFGVAVSARK